MSHVVDLELKGTDFTDMSGREPKYPMSPTSVRRLINISRAYLGLPVRPDTPPPPVVEKPSEASTVRIPSSVPDFPVRGLNDCPVNWGLSDFPCPFCVADADAVLGSPAPAPAALTGGESSHTASPAVQLFPLAESSETAPPPAAQYPAPGLLHAGSPAGTAATHTVQNTPGQNAQSAPVPLYAAVHPEHGFLGTFAPWMPPVPGYQGQTFYYPVLYGQQFVKPAPGAPSAAPVEPVPTGRGSASWWVSRMQERRGVGPRGGREDGGAAGAPGVGSRAGRRNLV
ncbi:hypothetical protein M501DRAFT_985311 [Patellaria atrata CBS 101060]|uniref:Uncharacterized protein n=1 Tax=Patellaria atrata CBS 101060 TaxID=1346257 RepID=A0A9P4VRP9_9PEZI|nr:hypothetical protein M501DRAFT_985311 [Patellaria atrata CBS 101060]